MDTSVKGLNKWANAHTNLWLDALRIALGVFFIFKGAYFITNSREFEDLIAPLFAIENLNPPAWEAAKMSPTPD